MNNILGFQVWKWNIPGIGISAFIRIRLKINQYKIGTNITISPRLENYMQLQPWGIWSIILFVQTNPIWWYCFVFK